MSITVNGKMNFPTVVCASTDVVGGKVSGANPGNLIFFYDNSTWWVVESDLSLAAWTLPVSVTGEGDASAANQTSVQTTLATPTVAPTKGILVIGKSSDGTPQYQPLPLGTSGTSVVISGSVTADTELPTASALNGTIAKSVSAPMVGAANMYSDGTNLVEVDSTHPLPVGGTIAVTGAGDASAANQTSVQVTIASPTVAPTKDILVSGKSNDATAQYQPIPEGAGGRSVIVEGYEGGTPQPVVGKCISKSVTFLRPHTTTQYTAKDALNVDVPVTGGTQATPTVLTAVAHGLADGDYVTISGVQGDTAANGSFYAKVTTYSADTFALYTDKALTTPVAGNSAWTSGGDVARLFRLKGIFRKAGGEGYITRVRIATNSATALLGDYLRIHFYRTPVAVSVDNSAYVLSYANFPNRCGYIDMPALIVEGAGGDMSYALAAPGSVGNSSAPCNIPLHVENGETIPDTDLYFRIEELSTGTPANDQPMFVEVTVDNN